MRPTAPHIAKIIDRIANALSSRPLLRRRRPLCLSQRSEINPRSKKTPVMAAPTIKNGFSPNAPTSEIYLGVGCKQVGSWGVISKHC